jgi:uncharacterized membrane protein
MAPFFTSRRHPLLLLAAMVVATLLYASLSLARYQGYNAGMLDLGNMSQAIASVSRGQPLMLTSSHGNVSRLAGHVEIAYFLLAPLYALWSDPRLLLMIQAVLFALGAIPVYAIAHRRFAASTSLLFALGYLLYPTSVAAVLFDLHGDTLAMPLLMFMLNALDGQRWRQFWLFLGLSLLCKVYIAAPVFLLGLTMLSRRTSPLDLRDVPQRRRFAIGICVAVGLYLLVVVLIVRPWFKQFAPGLADGTTVIAPGYIQQYFGEFASLGLTDVLVRLLHLFVVVAPGVLLWWWAGWTVLPAFAIILPALISTGPGGSYAWSYHHYAAAVPFLFAGVIQGTAHRVRRLKGERARSREARTAGGLLLIMTLLFHVGLNDTPLGIRFWRGQPGSGLDTSRYGRTSRDLFKDRWLAANVPPDVPIAASNFLAPRLVNRDTLFLVRYPTEAVVERLPGFLPYVDMVVADALFDYVVQNATGFSGGVDYDQGAIALMLRMPEWSLTSAQDGLLRFEREAGSSERLDQQITMVGDDTSAGLAQFGDRVELVAASIVPGEVPHRFRATFRWRALRDIKAQDAAVAVSRLQGVDHARIVHLPSYAIEPTTTWREGQVWEERFDVELPEDLAPGEYVWNTAWYSKNHPQAAWTDQRSRLGPEVPVTTLQVH